MTVRIEDKDGNFCPLASNRVNFNVEGAATIAAVGNGNAATDAPFIANYREAFNGLCMLIIRTNKEGGKISIQAESDGLDADSVKLTSL